MPLENAETQGRKDENAQPSSPPVPPHITAPAAPPAKAAPPETAVAAATEPKRVKHTRRGNRKQESEPVRVSSVGRNNLNTVAQVYARDTELPRTLFWQWSR